MKITFIPKTELVKPLTFPAFRRYEKHGDSFDSGIVMFHRENLYTVLYIPVFCSVRFVGELVGMDAYQKASPITDSCWKPVSGTISIEVP